MTFILLYLLFCVAYFLALAQCFHFTVTISVFFQQILSHFLLFHDREIFYFWIETFLKSTESRLTLSLAADALLLEDRLFFSTRCLTLKPHVNTSSTCSAYLFHEGICRTFYKQKEPLLCILAPSKADCKTSLTSDWSVYFSC